MIPSFNEFGVLPATPGANPYPCDRAEFAARFVDAFSGQVWRRALFDGWYLLRISVAELAPSARWWVWGSLVSSLPEPAFGPQAVVDAAVVIPVADFHNTDARRALLASSMQSAEQLHRTDVHQLVFEFDEQDRRRSVTDAALRSLRRRASRNIVDIATMSQIDAGFVEVLP